MVVGARGIQNEDVLVAGVAATMIEAILFSLRLIVVQRKHETSKGREQVSEKNYTLHLSFIMYSPCGMDMMSIVILYEEAAQFVCKREGHNDLEGGCNHDKWLCNFVDSYRVKREEDDED